MKPWLPEMYPRRRPRILFTVRSFALPARLQRPIVDTVQELTRFFCLGYDGSTPSEANGLTNKQKKRAEKKLRKRQQLADGVSSSARSSLASSPAPSASSTGDVGEGSSSGKAKKRKHKKVVE